MKTFLREWEQRSPGCTDSLFAALSNVATPLLLDRQLFDFAALRATGQADGQENARLDHDPYPACLSVLTHSDVNEIPKLDDHPDIGPPF